jgi:isoquinoline 1-oxidoreductase beta subunit
MRTFFRSDEAAAVDHGRRMFLATSAAFGAGLTIGFTPAANGATKAAAKAVTFNPFVHIAPDSTVTILAKHLEMGQGIYSGLAVIAAEELDADWAQVKVESAPADGKVYANLLLQMQGTGGSTSTLNSFKQMREAGAAARAMLVEAAAQKWGVPAAEITVSKGIVAHAGKKRQAKFGELADAASKLTPPQAVTLKDPKNFTLIGKVAPRVDSVSKTDGTAQFTQDVRLPNQITAMLIKPPAFGGAVKSFDGAEAKKIAGVVDVVQTPHGVAVLANDTWTAMKAREAVKVEWDLSQAETRTSKQLLAEYLAALDKPPVADAATTGDVEAAMKVAKKKVGGTYIFPYLAHAAMEPMNAVVQLKPDGAVLTYGAQLQTVDQQTVARMLGMKPEQVTINSLIAGGSFGRRAVPTSDYVSQAVAIAQAAKTDRPVKMVWTREDDMRSGYYRPMMVHRVEAGIDGAGALSAWKHHIVGQGILVGTLFEPFMVKNGIDSSAVEGAAKPDYTIPNSKFGLTLMRPKVPVLWWRSVGHTHNAYVMETMIDEAAVAAGQDPLAFRRALLAGKPRHLGVVDMLAAKSDWGSKLPAGTFRGVAVHESFSTVVGQVAEVEVSGKSFRVKRIVCVVDCGLAVIPDQVIAQMQGGIGFALSAALFDELTLGENGAVEQANFDSYRVLRMSEMPKIDVHIVPSAAPPTGVGEPGVPPLAPAVANALAAATGKRIRELPFAKQFEI